MNKREVRTLIEEWLKKPPCSRPLLDKAIAEQYRKALTCQWEGMKRDNLTEWLTETVCGSRALTEGEQDNLENHVAAVLDAIDTDAVRPCNALPLAAFKPSEEQKQMLDGYRDMPSDEEITERTRAILVKLQTGGQ